MLNAPIYQLMLVATLAAVHATNLYGVLYFVFIKLLLTFILHGYMLSCDGLKTAAVCGATLPPLGVPDTLFDPKITCDEATSETCMPSGRSDVSMWS